MTCRKACLPNILLWVLCLAGTLLQAQDYDSIMRFSLANLKHDFADMPAEMQASRLELETLRYPERQEAYYLLAYTYSRINSANGDYLLGKSYSLVLRTSEHLEKVIQIDSNYRGEVVILDVYSKIFSEWSSLAVKYLVQDEPDSARLCFHEASKRGGLNPWLLQHYRFLLDAVDSGSFILSSGDNCSFYLIYLQFMESYRPDVIVADVALLNASWYFPYLVKQGLRHDEQFDSLISDAFYLPWKDTVLNYSGIELLAAPHYDGRFIGQADRMILEIFSYYGPKRRFYLTQGAVPIDNFRMSERGCNEVLFVRFEGEQAKCQTDSINEFAWLALENLNKAETHDRSFGYLFDLYTYQYLFHLLDHLPEDSERVTQEYARFKAVFTQERHPEFYKENKVIMDYLEGRFKK